MNVLAFDIGGTQIKYGVVTRDGEVLSAQVVDTPKQSAALVQCLRELVGQIQQQFTFGGIAISTFGLVDVNSGMILGAAEAIPDYAGTSPKAILAQEFGLPVSIDNDVNCVALAEGWRGAAQGVAHYLAIAIGTGIGGGIVLNQQIYRGHRAAAGEWGYMKIDGLVWEDHASMRGLLSAANQRCSNQFVDGRAVFAAYDQQDLAVVPVVQDWFKLLATGVANLIYAFNPERVVIGGGVSARGTVFLKELNAAIDAQLLPDFQGMTEVVLACAGNHAGMIGATRNWLQTNKY
ncbi:ROK family protein [Deefgea piscis]|uniref:ROK family protein n=1 Tax=Deefgea piscis TaxID=2739061 RepID=A0A6M8SR32_9NEIS|nr:ROK family protein [Deefgea piscis]QKJ67742.1 ROK family protein [Deefgea piscis]